MKTIKPLDITAIRCGDSQQRKNAMRGAYPKAVFCIVRGCCTVARFNSPFCMAHIAGLAQGAK